MEASLDLRGLFLAASPIPVDEVMVELRRLSDSSIAFTDRIPAGDFGDGGDSLLIVDFSVNLSQPTEEFYLYVEARGGSVLYYTVRSTVSITANRRTVAGPLTAVYVGPGSAADEVILSLASDVVAPGDSVLATAVVYQNESVVPGAPVGIVSGDTLRLRARAVGLDQAWLVADANAAGSVIVSALTPIGLVDTTALTITAQTTLGTVSANSPVTQSAVVNQLVAAPPSVLVLDDQGGPASGVTVTFAITVGTGSLTGATPITDGSGIATVGGWRVGQLIGANTVTATVAGLPPVSFTATATPTAVATLGLISGDGQTADAGTALPLPLIVEVQDTFTNVVPGVSVDWAATDGSVAPPSGTTDAQGRAQATWTLGSSQASPTASATVGALQTIFTATTVFPTPTILLSFSGVPGVGVGLTEKAIVTLNQPAPAGGTAVSLGSDNGAIFTVAGGVTIAQGATTDSADITGVSAGSATLTATAPGYADGTLTVEVQNRNISVPITLNVPYGQTASLPVQLPAPAPAGGVTFTVASSDPTLVGVNTPSVTIAAGAQTTNATLAGLLPGPSTVTVSHPAYVTGTSTVTTAAALNIVEGSLTINGSFGGQVNIDFTSNGQGIAAPTPGVVVTAELTDSSCLGAASPRTIATGLVSTPMTITYAGVATLPCNARLKVTAPNIQPDSINVTVNPVPIITLNPATVGSGLQRQMSGSLGASNHGGVALTLTSGSPNLLLSSSQTTTGSGTLVINLLNNQSNFTYYAQVVEGVTGSTPVSVSATAPGFTDGTGIITVVQGAIDLAGVPATTTTLSAISNIFSRTGIPNSQTTPAFMQEFQTIRAGAAPLTVTFTNTDPGNASTLLKAGGVLADELTAQIPALSANSPTDTTSGGVALRPQASGTSVISASAPGFLQVTSAQGDTVIISQPTITVNAALVGSGLQRQMSGQLGASNHGGVAVSLSSGSPNLLLAPDAATPGASTLLVNVPNNQISFNYFVQVVEGLTGTTPTIVTATVPGFSDGTGTITLVQGAIDLAGVPANTTTLSAISIIFSRTGIPNSQTAPAFMQEFQAVRTGAPAPLTVTFTNTDPNSTSALLKAGGVLADQVTADIPIRSTNTPTDTTSGGVAFRPQAGGTSVVSASAPGFLQVTSATGVTVTITQPTITVNTAILGSGLQRQMSVQLGASNHGGVDVTLNSGSPNLLLSPSQTSTGSSTLVVQVPNNQATLTYYAQAIEGLTGSTAVPVTVTAPGFADGTGDITLVQGAIDLVGVPGTTTTLSPVSNLFSRTGIPNSQTAPAFMQEFQARRFGSPGPLIVTFTSQTAAVADLHKMGSPPGGTQTAQIPDNAVNTPTDTTSGGVALRPLLSGSSVISASAPGFLQLTSAAGELVTITQPSISLNNATVGSGLQRSSNGFLGASGHGGVQVILNSSNATVLLSPDAITAGAPSITLTIAPNQTSFFYYVQGLEGQPDTVTVAITATASGFTNGNGTVDVVPPGFDVAGVPANATAGGPDDTFIVRVGLPNSSATFMNEYQQVRIGAPGPLTVTVASSPVGVATLVTSAGIGETRQVQILPGQTNSPSTVASGGVAFRPLAPGLATTTTTIPGFIGTSGAVSNTTVQ